MSAADAHQELVHKVSWRPGKRNISMYGGYTLAIRRALGFASADTTIAMVAGENRWLSHCCCGFIVD